jgi:hypothetical protein
LITYAGQSTAPSAIPAYEALLLVLIGGGFFGVPGLLAYTGKWRHWRTGFRGSTFPNFPFGLAWMGAGTVLLGMFSLVAELGRVATYIAVVVFGLPAIAMFCCGLAFFIYTPRRFLPPWYREVRDRKRAIRKRRRDGW